MYFSQYGQSIGRYSVTEKETMETYKAYIEKNIS